MEQDELQAKQAAQDFYNSLTAEDKAEMLNIVTKGRTLVIDAIAKVIAQTQAEIKRLSDISVELWDKEKSLVYSPEKTAFANERKLADLSKKIYERYLLQKQNELQAFQNNGTRSDIEDQYGVVHPEIPDFRNILTNDITWDEDTILVEPRPVYIPLISKEVFASKGYLLDAIRVAPNSYLVATQSLKNPYLSNNYMLDKEYFEKAPKPIDQPYILVTLDQLVLIYDYYFTHAKAINKQEAERKNERQREHWFTLSVEKRQSYYNQRFFYNSIPDKIKKKVSQAQWDALTMEEKEKLYIPVKRYGVPRLTSKLEDNQMWSSFHTMYQAFIDKEAYPRNKHGEQVKNPDLPAGYADPNAFEYWRKFREMMEYKIKDIKIQRQDISETYSKALETSFGESNTDTVLRDKYGILVKRQNGSKINPLEIEDIKESWILCNRVFGNLKPHALSDNLKISHSANTYMFAMKAIGVYIPQFATIGVSKKYGQHQFNSTMSHEVGHWIDNFVGRVKGQRWATDDYESTAGIIAFTFRNNMNKPKNQQTDYVNATKECFARALQQYFGYIVYGDNDVISHSYVDLNRVEKITNVDDYVSKETFETKIKPLIEQFLTEIRDIIATGVDFDNSEDFTPTAQTIEIPKDEIDVPVNNKQINAQTPNPYPEFEISTVIDISNEQEPIPLPSLPNSETNAPEMSNYKPLSFPKEFTADWHTEVIDAINGGTITVEDFKRAYQYVIDQKPTIIALLSSFTKDKLLLMLGQMSAYRLKNEKKPDVVDGVYKEILQTFQLDSITYDMGQTYAQALAKKVETTTQADLEKHAADYAQHVAEMKARREKILKALTNPETKEEFDIFIKKYGIEKLTPEQKRMYDAFVSDAVLDVREKQIEQKANITQVEGVDSEMTIIETIHTRDKYPLWVVQMADRVSVEKYKELNAKAKQLGGYYSSFRGNGAIPGFQFKSQQAAENFVGLKKGNISNLEQIEQRIEQKTQSRAQKLKENAHKILARVEEELSRDRQTNTYRRANQANSIEARLNDEKRIAKTMLNIAGAIESDQAKFLDNITSKTHIELLDLLIRSAHRNELSTLYPTYTEQQEHKADPVTVSTIDYLKEGLYPKIYGSALKDLINKAENRPGAKLIAKRWEKKVAHLAENDSYQVLSNNEMQEIATMFSSLMPNDQKYNRIKDTLENYGRLKTMKIENDSMLREVLREYLTYREGAAEVDKVKLLERKLAGKGSSVGFDYFPTPLTVAGRMVDLAQIMEGNTVLEPSAGNGNIADVIKEHGFTPDVIELSSTLREILDAKGYPIVANDFELFSEKHYDRIIMNPPFSDGKDAEHIIHAYELLNPGGTVVAIAGEGIFTRSDKKAVAFREFLEEHDAEVERLDPKTFLDKSLYSTTGANARIVVINKPENEIAPIVKPAKPEVSTQEESISELIDGLELLLEVAQGSEKAELQDLIEGLKLLI